MLKLEVHPYKSFKESRKLVENNRFLIELDYLEQNKSINMQSFKNQITFCNFAKLIKRL